MKRVRGTCSVEGCLNKHIAKGLCGGHYARLRNNLPMDGYKNMPGRLLNKGKECSSDNCTREAERKQMCMAHYQRWQKYKDTLPHIPIIIEKGWYKRKKDGYIAVPGDNGKYIMEHIKIMSQWISRPLLKGETVHHKNGIRDDNRIENLELWSGNHPAGSRISDLIIYALEIIKTYGDNPNKYE